MAATANVRNVIEIAGVDNASDAIKRAQASLKGLEATAGRTGQATHDLGAKTGEGVKKIQDTSGDLESALKGIKDFAPGVAGELSGLGDAFGATESVMRLLPGPMGLVATGIVAVGAGAYMLARNASEATAKLALLGNADTSRLKDALGLSVDGAVKLTQALDDLKDQTLRPTDSLLQQVAKNAERMRKDGGDAATAFVLALGGGPDALKRFQAEYGKLNGLIADKSALAAQIGLNSMLLGLVKAQTAEEERQAVIDLSITRIQERKVELAKLDADLAHAQGTAKEAARVIDRIDAERQARALAAKADAVRDQIALDQAALEVVQRETQARQAQADAMTALVARADVLDAQAGATADKKHRAQLQSEANTVRLLAATRALNQFDRLHGQTLDAKLTTERATLQVRLLQAQAADQAAKDAKRQEAAQAAQEAAARRQAAYDVAIRTARARADRDGLQTERERIDLLDRDRAKDLDATRTIKGAKARADARLAVNEEYRTKRAALDRAIAEETRKTNDDLTATLETGAKRTADLTARAADATVNAARARASSMADSLRAQGREEEALLVELRQARADYAADVARIDAERLATLRTVAAGTTDAANVEIEAAAKVAAAKVALAAIERRVAQAQADNDRARRAGAADSLLGVADAMRAFDALDTGAFGEGLSAGINGLKQLDAAMAKTEGRAVAVTAALGGAFTGIAKAASDAETARTLAQIDADAKRRLSTATTEEERAAITEESEARKAKAVEDGERRSAGILALVEGAKAIASVASGDFVGAAGHGAAALAFGAIAGGAIGGGAVGGTGAAGGFNAPAAAPSLNSKPDGGGKGTTIIYNFNQPLATKQEIGKVIQGSLRSLSGTGADKAKGV